MGSPPSDFGGCQLTVVPPSTGATVTSVGAPGFFIDGGLAPAGVLTIATVAPTANRTGRSSPTALLTVGRWLESRIVWAAFMATSLSPRPVSLRLSG